CRHENEQRSPGHGILPSSPDSELEPTRPDRGRHREALTSALHPGRPAQSLMWRAGAFTFFAGFPRRHFARWLSLSGTQARSSTTQYASSATAMTIAGGATTGSASTVIRTTRGASF